MAEQTPLKPETPTAPPKPATKADTASRCSSDAKPRREPYRPSTSAAALSDPPVKTTAATAATHIDVVPAALATAAAPVKSGKVIGTSSLRPSTNHSTRGSSTTTVPREQDAVSMPAFGLDPDDQLRITGAANLRPTAAIHANTIAVASPALRSAPIAHSRGSSLSFTGTTILFTGQERDVATPTTARVGAERRTSTTHHDSVSSIHVLSDEKNYAHHEALENTSPVCPPLSQSFSNPTGAMQHRRTLSTLIASVPTSTRKTTPTRTNATALTSADTECQLHSRDVPCPSPVAEGNRSRAIDTAVTNINVDTQQSERTKDANTTAVPLQGVQRPLCNHKSVLSIDCINEASLLVSTHTFSLKSAFAASPSASLRTSHNATHVAIAHIMQRENIRRLLSRVLFCWTLFRKKTQQEQQQHRQKINSNEKDVLHDISAVTNMSRASPTAPTYDSADNNNQSKNNTVAKSTFQWNESTVPSTSPLPPWRPIAGCGVRSCSTPEDRDEAGTVGTAVVVDDDGLVDPEEGKDEHEGSAQGSSGGSLPGLTTNVSNEIGGSGASTQQHQQLGTAQTMMSGELWTATPRYVAQATQQATQGPGSQTPQPQSQWPPSSSSSRGAMTEESSADIPQSGSFVRQQQQPTPSANGTNTHSSAPSESSPSFDTSFSAKSLSQHSLVQQARTPPRTSRLSVSTQPTTVRRSVSPGAQDHSNYTSKNISNVRSTIISPPVSCPLGRYSNPSTGTSSTNVATTPRQQPQQQGSETKRRKSVVSQYLAGKPLGNSPPLQSSTILVSNTGPTTNGVVEVHSLILPGAVSIQQQQQQSHSRSSSTLGGTFPSGLDNSFPRRRSDGHWNLTFTTTATTTGNAGPAAAEMFSDSEDQNWSSLNFTPRSRQSNGVGGVAALFDDDSCLSNSSMSAIAAGGGAAITVGGAGGPGPAISPVCQNIPQLLLREAEARSKLSASEARRRAQFQRKTAARMDQLMMMALHRRPNERGLHPSLRTSSAPSPMMTSRSNSSSSGSSASSDAVIDSDFVNRNCTTSNYNIHSTIDANEKDGCEHGGSR